MYGMSKSLNTKLQRQQNTLVRVVLRTNRLSSAGPLLSELHWLPVASRIQFKIATLTHKILSTGTPSYLSSLLNHYQPTPGASFGGHGPPKEKGERKKEKRKKRRRKKKTRKGKRRERRKKKKREREL